MIRVRVLGHSGTRRHALACGRVGVFIARLSAQV